MSGMDSITIGLVEPEGPRNIGSAARALKNFGLHRLSIVGNPDLEHEECRQMAVGAHDVLEASVIHPSLDSALVGTTLVVGTTARRRYRRPTDSPRDIASMILESPGQTAILYGRESSGLTSDELARCQRVVSVPTSSDKTSINLAQAVILVAYELFLAAPEAPMTAGSDDGDLVDEALRRRLEVEFVQACEKIGYLHEGSRDAIEASIARFVRLGPIQTRDARAIFGFLRSVQRLVSRDGRSDV